MYIKNHTFLLVFPLMFLWLLVHLERKSGLYFMTQGIESSRKSSLLKRWFETTLILVGDFIFNCFPDFLGDVIIEHSIYLYSLLKLNKVLENFLMEFHSMESLIIFLAFFSIEWNRFFLFNGNIEIMGLRIREMISLITKKKSSQCIVC